MWQAAREDILIYLMAAQRDVRYVVNQGCRFALWAVHTTTRPLTDARI